MPLPTATIRNELSVPLRFADGYTTAARVFSFDGLVDGRENLAFGLGDWAATLTSGAGEPAPLVRPHSECLTGDVFGSQRCDCGPQLREAVERIADSGGFPPATSRRRRESEPTRSTSRCQRAELRSDAGVASQLVTRVGFKPILAVTHGRSPAVAHRRS